MEKQPDTIGTPGEHGQERKAAAIVHVTHTAQGFTPRSEPRYTKAAYARTVSELAVLVARETAYLAGGMWNPDFCASDATSDAAGFLEIIAAKVAHIQTRITPPNLAADGSSK